MAASSTRMGCGVRGTGEAPIDREWQMLEPGTDPRTDAGAHRGESLCEEILRSNQAVRQWAAGLRDRGTRARAESRHRRARAGAAVGPPPLTRRPQPAPDLPGFDPAGLPSLGEVRVEELVAILVDDHGFAVARAERALAHGMMICGYPRGHDSVVAADAFEVVERAVRRP